MRTIEIKLYEFDELSDDAKKKAIENQRHMYQNDNYAQWFYDEAHETIKEFIKLFPVQTGRRSWLEPSFTGTPDNLMELKGLRLRTWFINNSWNWITKRKYLKHFHEHKMGSNLPFFRKNETAQRTGNKYCQVYSRINRERSCVLTGICYDDDMLQPLYDFLDFKDPENMAYYDFEEVIRDCFTSLKRSLESEEEYMLSDEYITEELQNNGYEFTEDGEKA